jgi:hypothetical protein
MDKPKVNFTIFLNIMRYLHKCHRGIFLPLLALLLAQTISAQTITIGETNLLTVADSGNANLLCAQSCTLTQAAVLQSLSFYVRVASGNLVLGLFKDNGSGTAPGALLAQTASFTPLNGWNTVAVSGVVLQPGTYWLIYLPSSNDLGFWNGFTGSEVHISQPFGAMPNPFPISGLYGNGDHWSFYATLLPVTSTPTATPYQTPTIVQHVSSASNNDVQYAAGAGEPGNPFYINLPNAAQAGNCLILSFSNPYSSSRKISITDNENNNWSLINAVNNGTTMSSTYVALNVAAGTQNITVTFDTGLYGFQFCATEAYNVLSASAVDGRSSATTTGTGTVASGSVTTTSPGDLIYQYGYDTDNTLLTSTGMTGMTSGPGFTFLSADVMLGTFAQYQVQSSAGAILPVVTVAGVTDAFNTVAIALRGGIQGSAPPPGIRIVGVHHVDYYHPGTIIIPSSGNLLYVSTAFGSGNVNINSISSAPSNSWIELPNTGAANGPPQCFYAANATTSPNLTLAITGPTGISSQISFVIYDIAGAATSPFDTSWDASGNAPTEPEGNFSFGTITPSTSNGLVIATMATYSGVITATTGSVQVLDSVTYGNETDADLMDNADAYAHYYNSDTSPITFSWTLGGDQSSAEAPQIVAFEAAAAGPSLTPAPTPAPTATPIPTPHHHPRH